MINKVVHVQSEDGQCPDGAERLNQLQHVYRNTLDWARCLRGGVETKVIRAAFSLCLMTLTERKSQAEESC